MSGVNGHMRRQVCWNEGDDSVLGSLILILLYSNHCSSTMGDEEHPCLFCPPIKFPAACHSRSLVFFLLFLKRRVKRIQWNQFFRVNAGYTDWKQPVSSLGRLLTSASFSCMSGNPWRRGGEILSHLMVTIFCLSFPALYMQQKILETMCPWWIAGKWGCVWKFKLPHPLHEMSPLD